MNKISVAVIVSDDSLLSAVIGIGEIFDISNGFCRKPNEAFFEINYLSSTALKDSSIIQVHTKILREQTYDLIVVPPAKTAKVMRMDGILNQWLIRRYHEGSVLCAACVGSFVLAQTDLLNHKRATTHWLFESEFKQKFPVVNLMIDHILIDEGNLITAGGVTAYFDLCLHIIQRYLSNDTANHCASLLLVERGRISQRCYKDLSHTGGVEDEEIKALLEWIKKRFEDNLSIPMMAAKMGLKERSFIRRFKASVEMTPNEYLQNLRIEKAKSLLISSTKSFEQITYDVGFHNESSFRRLFKRETSLNPGEYRKKFRINMF